MKAFLFALLMAAGSFVYGCEPKPKGIQWAIVYKCTLVAVIEFEETDKQLIVKVPLSMCANGINTAGMYGRDN